MSSISVEKMILHVLDNSTGLPLFSEKEHPFKGEIMDFIANHIEKAFNDIDIRKVAFDINNNPIGELAIEVSENSLTFREKTIEFAQIMYDVMAENTTIPACDLVCSLFLREGIRYLGFFIFNYKSSYMHYVDESSEGRLNIITKQKTALPNENQKVDEFIIINLEDYSLLLKEKKYEINGEKDYYISKHILKLEPILSDKEKIDIVNKVSKKMIKEYYENDIEKLAEMKKAIVESIEDTNSIDIDHIKSKVFKNNVELYDKYDEEIAKRGLTERVIPVSESLEKKVPKTQKLVANNGIEIKIPVSYLTESNHVEFINNPDGTISIILKNIKELQGK
ncbi:MAG: nucleoid-associated protein [Tissierellia bacterium]|nr:nucleoid-associated protein [Tissierellia bacterium]